ncbi:MAG: hypothetical protein ACLQPD_00895 [Desulfomonilaceae bacterium]
MDSKLLQTLRYRLQNRVRRLREVDWQFYHWQLVQFWTFLNSHIVFKTILKLLEEEKSQVFERVKPLLEESSPRDTIPVFDDEKDQAAAAYFVMKECIQTPANHAQNQKELHVGKRYTHSTKFHESIDAFTRIFVMPLYEYLDEQLDSRNILLYLLVRYKHVSEWFRRESLLKRYNDAESRKGEKVLAYDLYEFLYSQGLDFHIEPKSATGEIDLISEQGGDERLLVDAKVFNDSPSNIKAGFHQIYTYTTTYNQPFGCLAIFNVGDKQLCFASQQDDPQFGIFSITGTSARLL